ncbi:efflux RND transporter periplasmic adaptor subunit [Neorhodopirellula lusitana]|uniref:efflux RND transporter periplasmic adaptor subunit n=1 Tax=Neorhodopirellula lusitana TaxID=445327 RepID=UPI00384B178D
MPKPTGRIWGKRLLVLPPILLAVLAYAWLVKHSPPLQTEAPKETARMLEVMVVPRLDIRPKVSGFGTAKYARSWRAVTQVEGRINKIHPELRPGSMIEADEVLLEIDDSDYRSRVDELNAAIEQQNAELEQLEQSIENNEKTLVLEREVLTILQREFEREQSLLSRQAGSSASIDSKRRELLNQQKAVQDLVNSTALVTPQIKALQAELRQSAVQKEQAQRDVKRTKIRAPFRMRVGEVQLEVGQFVGVGENLFNGFNTAEVEIDAQLPLHDIHRLFVSQAANPEFREVLEKDSVLEKASVLEEDSALDEDSVLEDESVLGQDNTAERTSTLEQTNPLEPVGALSREIVRHPFAFDALVNVAGAEGVEAYPGRFLRVREIVDTQTKMVGFVVGVTNIPPHAQEHPKPPLLEGAFCDVDVFGETMPDQIVIPRNAIRNNSVYIVDQQNRLATRSVTLTFTQDEYAVIESGLTGGENLVIANPSPAIVGMLVEPVVAQEATDKLIRTVAALESATTVPPASPQPLPSNPSSEE